MRKEEFDSINKLENSHWWYVGTREICFSILERFLPKNTTQAILDVGCGTGGNMKYMQKFGQVEGFDIDAYTVELCKKNGFNCFVLDMEKADLPKEKYDLITLFDVFNQIPEQNQAEALQKLKFGLKKDGILAMREPGMKIAGGRHDIEVNIKMRFEKDYIKKLLENNGFKVLYIGYVNTLLFLPIVLKRKVDLALNHSPKSDVQETSEPFNTILLNILRIEKFLLKFIKMPFGVSLFFVAQKA